MSQELAQDEDEADAEDYEFNALDSNRATHNDYEYAEHDNLVGSKGYANGDHGHADEEYKEDQVVFALDDEEDPEEGGIHNHKGGYGELGNGRGKYDKRD